MLNKRYLEQLGVNILVFKNETTTEKHLISFDLSLKTNDSTVFLTPI